jgi:hypothetical protein
VAIALLLFHLSAAALTLASVEIAHYPLLADGIDTTGNNDPMTLENAPFQDGGVYCNGVYWLSGLPDSYLVETPRLPALDFESLAISAEFKISRYPSFTLPVFVGGHNGRWLGAEVAPDGTLGMLYNNANQVPGSQTVSLDEWHRALITYDGAIDEARLYLDDQLTCTATFVIEAFNANRITTENFANGTAFLGVFRQLIVYDAPFVPAPVETATWGLVKALFRPSTPGT